MECIIILSGTSCVFETECFRNTNRKTSSLKVMSKIKLLKLFFGQMKNPLLTSSADGFFIFGFGVFYSHKLRHFCCTGIFFKTYLKNIVSFKGV